jgi:hypothetical protein
MVVSAMRSSAGPSPLWLGIIAILSFGGLVVAAFASGYHLVGDAPVGLAPVAPNAGVGKLARYRVVRRDIEKGAVAHSSPQGGEVVGKLRPEQPVSILAEKDEWVQIRYEQDGQAREGWIEAVNLSSTER